MSLRTDVDVSLLQDSQDGRLRQAQFVPDSLCSDIASRVVLDDLLP